MPSVKCNEQLTPLITKPTPQLHSRNTQLPFPTLVSTNLSLILPPSMPTHAPQQSNYYIANLQIH
jgi:hypothetical protein